MSSTTNAARSGARTRVPRFAEAAVERARLTVVPQRALGRTQAARTPFAVLVLAVLVAGVVGLLMFNTHMQQSSFRATALQQQVTTLSAKEQSLTMELEDLRDPQRLARAAKQLHMVVPTDPAFVRLADGTVLGKPTPAGPGSAMRINPLPSPKPASIVRRTVVVKVPASTSSTDTPRTSTAASGPAGRKKASSQTGSQTSAQTGTQTDPGATR